MEILRKTRGISVYYEISLKKRYYREDEQGEDRGGACYITEMLQNNRFSGLLPVRLQWMDMVCSLLFKADGCSSLAGLFGKREPGWAEVVGLMKDISVCIRELQDHLLPPEGIVLSAAYIFRDENFGHFRFLYTPEPECSFSYGMKKLMEEIMPLFAHENKEDVVRFYDLYGKFLDDRFTPGMFLSLTDAYEGSERMKPAGELQVHSKQEIQLPVLWDPKEAGGMDESGAGTQLPEPEKRSYILYFVVGGLLLTGLLVALFLKNKAVMKIIGSVGLVLALFLLVLHFFFGAKNKTEDKKGAGCCGTVPPFGDRGQRENPGMDRQSGRQERIADGTRVMNGCDQNENLTVRHGPGGIRITRLIPADTVDMQPIPVIEGTFRIGRSEEENEYCIPDPEISRVHADLNCKDGVVYLRDLNSTNGTYVNQVRITGERAAELHYGDVVSFAGEEYYCV